MRMMCGLARCTAVLATWLVLTAPEARAQIDKGAPPPDGGGPTPNALPCGPETNPCLPHIFVSNVVLPSPTADPESGPYTWRFTVTNNGKASGNFLVTCIAPGPQFPCVDPNPEQFTLAESASRVVTVGFTTRGLGAFVQKLALQVTGTTGIADRDTVTGRKIYVKGVPIATHFSPVEGGELATADTLQAQLSHPSGINTTATHLVIDNVQRAAQVTSTKLTATASALALPGGAHDWLTYACATNGRCDSVRTTFTALAPPTVWALDDSLPPAQGHGIEGLLGGLPLPPIELRGCALTDDHPEINISPGGFVSQPGSGSAPSGYVFLASVAMNDTMRISTRTVDLRPSQPGSPICADYSWLPPSSFDWSYWVGSSASDTLWSGYPYSDRGQLATTGGTSSLLRELASALPGSGIRSRSGPSRGGTKSLPTGSFLDFRRSRSHGSALGMLPSPGAIDPRTFRLTLNGQLIASDSTSRYSGVIVEYTRLSGSSVKFANTSALLNRFNPANPSANNGGWNEIVATIADSTGHTSSIRTRFALLDPGLVSPLPLAALRDFSHLDQGECAAFGVFQCGGVMVSQAIPGFVTRDRDRSLHLVYRSASQRAPALLPIQVTVPRAQRAPESVDVIPRVGGVLAGDTLRYAGTKGTVSGVGSSNLWENANEVRVVGAQVNAPATGNATIQTVTVAVHSDYGAGVVRDDPISQELVQLYLSDTSATRFGRGWQLAELGRLVLLPDAQGTPAAIWLSGDGSYSIFRKPGTTWLAPPGEAVRLIQLATLTNGARYVIYLDNGASLGFRDDGWQAYTADLAGNRSTFNYLNATSTRLTSIVDPTGKRFLFNYFSSGLRIGQVSAIVVQASATATDTAKVATFDYDTANGGARLRNISTIRDPGVTESTLFAYKANVSYGAYLDSIVDPRSTTAKPVVTKFAYDPLLYSPVSVTRPADRFGAALMSVRDP